MNAATSELTVEVWAHSDASRAEVMQPLVSQWPLPDRWGNARAFDAGATDGLDAAGFLGAVFDGRFIYFSPQHNTTGRHGVVLRYDTHESFDNRGAWAAYDAGHTQGLRTAGYYGAIFDGRFIYFVPRRDNERYHTRVLRYDTAAAFGSPASWESHDLGRQTSYQGAAFDGRYLYFAPGYEGDETHPSGTVFRFDTRAPFKSASSWSEFDAGNIGGLPTRCFDGGAFDGRRILFVPLDLGCALSYDISGPFDSEKSWRAMDVRPMGIRRCVGSVFDGRYWYLVPYGPTRHVVRFDTGGAFDDAARWESFDAGGISGLPTIGYDGGAFDGRYVYFIPFWDGTNRAEGFHANLLRYDTTLAFTDAAAWSAVDLSTAGGLHTVGYNAGAFDGRYLYWAPWHDGRKYFADRVICGHGRVLRYDTTGPEAVFSLRWCDYGHNGGLSAAVPGPAFIVNTELGPRSVRAHRVLESGLHHLVGVYDGRFVKLYVDGVLAGQQTAIGSLASSNAPISVGRLMGGSAGFEGRILFARVARVADDAAEVAARFRRAMFREL